MTIAATNEHQRREDPPSSSWKERLVIILLILGASLGLLYYQMPKATISVTPQVLQLSEDLVFEFSQLAGVDLKKASIMLTRKTAATGRQQIGITKAKGVITLVNQNDTNVTVPKGTVVQTGSGISFVTVKDVEVPALTTNYFMDVPIGLIAGQAEVEIEAVELGSSGNVAAGRITTIKGFDLNVRNPDPTNGGDDAILHIASEDDLVRVKNLVKQDAPKLALDALFQQIGTGFVLEETMEFDLDWLEETAIGQETNEVYASAMSKGQVYTVYLDILGKHLNQALQNIVPEGFQIQADSIAFSDLKVTKEQDWQIILEVQAKALGNIDSNYLAQVLAGADEEDLQAVVAGFPNIANISVTDYSGKRLPRIAKWLNIQVESAVY